MSDDNIFKTERQAGADVESSLEAELDEVYGKLYGVVFHNDDVTTFDFVVNILVVFFDFEEVEAWDLAFDIHVEGSATIGAFDYATALMRKNMVIAEARENGFPLHVSLTRLP